MFIVVYHMEGDSPQPIAIDAKGADEATDKLTAHLNDEYGRDDMEDNSDFYIDSISELDDLMERSI